MATGSRQPDRGGVLSRDDLFLLMESYRNTIELNTTLLEQQKQIIEGNKKILDSNTEICERIEAVADKLDACTIELSKTHQQWNETRLQYNATNTQEHLKLKNHLNVVVVAMGTLCVGIIGASIKAVYTFSSWSEEIHLLEHIARAVGVG